MENTTTLPNATTGALNGSLAGRGGGRPRFSTWLPPHFPEANIAWTIAIAAIGMLLNGIVIGISRLKDLQNTSYKVFTVNIALMNFVSLLIRALTRSLLNFYWPGEGDVPFLFCSGKTFTLRLFAGLTQFASHPLILQRYVVLCHANSGFAQVMNQRWGQAGLCGLMVVPSLFVALNTLFVLPSGGRGLAGLSCTVPRSPSPWAPADFVQLHGRMVMAVLGAHYGLLAWYTVRVSGVLRLKQSLVSSTTTGNKAKERAAIREGTFVLRAGVTQAMAPAVFIAPLFFLAYSGVGRTAFNFFLATEFFNLTKVFDGICALMILRPYRLYLSSKLRMLLGLATAQHSGAIKLNSNCQVHRSTTVHPKDQGGFTM